jgi:hypothetical protein
MAPIKATERPTNRMALARRMYSAVALASVDDVIGCPFRAGI